MTWGYNCLLFGRPVGMGAKGYSDKGTLITRFKFAIRTSTNELIFAIGPTEYYHEKPYIKKWSKTILNDTFGTPQLYPLPNPYWGEVDIQNIDESLLNNAYIEVSWFSILEIKEYYAKIILTKSDIEILKDLALNDGWGNSSIRTGKVATPRDIKQVNFIIRLSVGGIGFVNAKRDINDEYLFKHILGVAIGDQKQLSRIQKLTQLKDLDYAQFFKDQYKDEDFLKTFKNATQVAKESNSDVSKCYPFNNYGSIITSIRKSTNIYKYKINIDRRYKVAHLIVMTTAQEEYNLVGREIFEKILIAAPINYMFMVIEIPDNNGNKKWKEMRFTFLEDYITSCSSPNKNDKDSIIEYFSNLDELSGYPQIIGNNITVDQNGVNSIVDRKLYEKLNLITYSMIIDFEKGELELFMQSDQNSYGYGCPLANISIGKDFIRNESLPPENGNNTPVFPKGTELD